MTQWCRGRLGHATADPLGGRGPRASQSLKLEGANNRVPSRKVSIARSVATGASRERAGVVDPPRNTDEGLVPQQRGPMPCAHIVVCRGGTCQAVARAPSRLLANGWHVASNVGRTGRVSIEGGSPELPPGAAASPAAVTWLRASDRRAPGRLLSLAPGLHAKRGGRSLALGEPLGHLRAGGEHVEAIGLGAHHASRDTRNRHPMMSLLSGP